MLWTHSACPCLKQLTKTGEKKNIITTSLSFSGVTNINSWRVKSALSNVVSLTTNIYWLDVRSDAKAATLLMKWDMVKEAGEAGELEEGPSVMFHASRSTWQECKKAGFLTVLVFPECCLKKLAKYFVCTFLDSPGNFVWWLGTHYTRNQTLGPLMSM